MNPVYLFFEIVEVLPTRRTKELNIAGRPGAILGISPTEDESTQTTYAVHIYDRGAVFSLQEDELRATGRSASRDEFYSGEVIRVTQAGDLSDEQP